jgi:Fic family protein
LNNKNRSSRHRIVNNLQATINFCPLIHKTEKLENYINSDLSTKKNNYFSTIQKSVLQRASTFLLLKDSKASFTIEGETPANNLAIRLGKAIGKAGGQDLSEEELNRLQQIIIEDNRFIELGFRKKGGFVGEYDRETTAPLHEHISAKYQDIEQLIDGLIATNQIVKNVYDEVLSAVVIAFEFAFIHPFENGNGRLHRNIIHHVLAKRKFSQQGIIFPISLSILDQRQIIEQSKIKRI